MKPGGLREMHWHPNADEWQYYLTGKARMTVFNTGPNANTAEFMPGDIGYVPKSLGHYIENIGKDGRHPHVGVQEPALPGGLALPTGSPIRRRRWSPDAEPRPGGDRQVPQEQPRPHAGLKNA